MNVEEPKFDMSPEALEEQRQVEKESQLKMIERMRSLGKAKKAPSTSVQETEGTTIKEEISKPKATRSLTDAKNHALYHSFRSQDDK